jgi:hypothetical protein
MFVSRLKCNLLVPKIIHSFVKMEVVAPSLLDYVVVIYHGCGKVGLGRSVLKFQGLLALVIKRLPLFSTCFSKVAIILERKRRHPSLLLLLCLGCTLDPVKFLCYRVA